MKMVLITGIVCLMAAGCSRVTTRPDTHTTTSGTLGTVKATEQLPKDRVDTTLRPGDTLKMNRDTLP